MFSGQIKEVAVQIKPFIFPDSLILCRTIEEISFFKQ